MRQAQSASTANSVGKPVSRTRHCICREVSECSDHDSWSDNSVVTCRRAQSQAAQPASMGRQLASLASPACATHSRPAQLSSCLWLSLMSGRQQKWCWAGWTSHSWWEARKYRSQLQRYFTGFLLVGAWVDYSLGFVVWAGSICISAAHEPCQCTSLMLPCLQLPQGSSKLQSGAACDLEPAAWRVCLAYRSGPSSPARSKRAVMCSSWLVCKVA